MVSSLKRQKAFCVLWCGNENKLGIITITDMFSFMLGAIVSLKKKMQARPQRVFIAIGAKICHKLSETINTPTFLGLSRLTV